MIPHLLKNRYRIIANIATGGFGETFLAEDTQMPSARRCAIKLLKPVNDNQAIYEAVKERFSREANLLERLSQSSHQIPQLYAYFEEAGQFYLVQELIEGKNLAELVQDQGLMNENEVKNIVYHTLIVLDNIHTQGVIHRDIKPDNIILRERDRLPVLIDFGAVKETMGTVLNSQGKAVSSILVGTPGFMSPEQAAGHSLYSSDLFSLGMTAIYLLTGKIPQELPKDNNTNEFLWRYFAPRVSAKFASLIDKAIKFNVDERYSSAKQMLLDLPKPSPLKKTERSLPPPTMIAFPHQGNNLPLKEQAISWWRRLEDWQKATAIGVFAGAIIGLGFAIFDQPKPASNATNTSNNQVSGQEKNQFPNTVGNCQGLPIVYPTFYFLADSALLDPLKAQEKCQLLAQAGHEKAGFFASQNYANLSKLDNYQVYIDLFPTQASCEQALKIYQKNNPKAKAYCALAQKMGNR